MGGAEDTLLLRIRGLRIPHWGYGGWRYPTRVLIHQKQACLWQHWDALPICCNCFNLEKMYALHWRWHVDIKKKEKLHPPKEHETLSKHATISRHRDKGVHCPTRDQPPTLRTLLSTHSFGNIPSKYADIELNVESVKKWQFVNFPFLTDWIAIFWMRWHGSACQRQSVTPRYWFSSAFAVSIGDGCIWEEVCGMRKIPQFNFGVESCAAIF